MERTQVKSSNIKSIGYDADSKTLEVEFIGGRLYQYKNVDSEKHDALMKSESVGKFYAANIKNKYDWQALMDSEPKNLENNENSIDVK